MSKQELNALLKQLPDELTTGGVMKALGCARRTVIRYRQTGTLSYRIQNPYAKRPDYRYPAADVLAMRTNYQRDSKKQPRPNITPAGAKAKPFDWRSTLKR